jgi:hypothetical protein
VRFRETLTHRARLSLGALVLIAFLCPSYGGAAPGDPGEGEKARLRGKVTRQGLGIEGARVFAYRSFEDLLAFRPAAESAPTDGEGDYRLELPPGAWYLVAKKRTAAGDGPLAAGGLYSFHGSNPFTLPPGPGVTANFSLARKEGEAARKPAADPGAGSLEGVATSGEGEGMEGVRVTLYLDAGDDFRGMGYAVAPPTDSSGSFRFDFLPDGGYYVVARRRAGGAGAGPLAEGDFYGWYVENPAAVKSGSSVKIELEMVNKGRETANADARPRPSGTRIAGRVTDGSGRAVPGAYAFAYEEAVMSHRKPAFISREADGEGRYTIYLSRGGTWYVGARSGYGDAPARGEWYGRYDGAADHSVEVETGGRRDGIDIVVERILPP